MSVYEDGAAAADALSEFTEKYAGMIDGIRRICVETLRMAFENEQENNGIITDQELKAQQSMAYMILDELELEVDFWFCGRPILKDKESE
jgi:hypothetical protein